MFQGSTFTLVKKTLTKLYIVYSCCKTFWYSLCNDWKSEWHQAMYKLYHQNILSSLHCWLRVCPCGWRGIIDNKQEYLPSSNSECRMGETAVVHVMAFGTIIVHQKIPLFILSTVTSQLQASPF